MSGFDRHAALFERAQISQRTGERESEFLRLGPARIVDDTPICDRKWPAKAVGCQFGNCGGESGRQILPGLWAAAGGGKAANRIEAKAQIDRRRVDAAMLDQRSEGAHPAPGSRT